MTEDESLVKELCEIESGLTEWEVNFVESITKQVKAGGSLSQKQRDMGERILRDKG